MSVDRSAQEEIVVNLMAWGDVEPRRMFGCDCYLVRGRLFVWFERDGLVVKIPSPRREEMLRDARVRPLTTSMGSRFGDWLRLRLSGPDDVPLALPAVQESYRYVQATASQGRRRRK